MEEIRTRAYIRRNYMVEVITLGLSSEELDFELEIAEALSRVFNTEMVKVEKVEVLCGEHGEEKKAP